MVTGLIRLTTSGAATVRTDGGWSGPPFSSSDHHRMLGLRRVGIIAVLLPCEPRAEVPPTVVGSARERHPPIDEISPARPCSLFGGGRPEVVTHRVSRVDGRGPDNQPYPRSTGPYRVGCYP
jgi:hypothetical protein